MTISLLLSTMLALVIRDALPTLVFLFSRSKPRRDRAWRALNLFHRRTRK
jgi:hypothetical protein